MAVQAPNAKEILLAMLTSYINHLLTSLAGILITYKVLTPDLATETNIAILGAAVVSLLASGGVLLYRKVKQHYFVEVARTADPNTPVTTLRKQAKAAYIDRAAYNRSRSQ